MSQPVPYGWEIFSSSCPDDWSMSRRQQAYLQLRCGMTFFRKCDNCPDTFFIDAYRNWEQKRCDGCDDRAIQSETDVEFTA